MIEHVYASEPTAMNCPHCGDEIDDMGGVCACVFARQGSKSKTNGKGQVRTSMRRMVARKLEAHPPKARSQ